MATMRLSGRPVIVLLDSASTITLIWPSTLPKAIQLCSSLVMKCVYEHVREVLAAEGQKRDHWGEWLLLVGLVPELPVPLLIGRDCLGIPNLSSQQREGSQRSR